MSLSLILFLVYVPVKISFIFPVTRLPARSGSQQDAKEMETQELVTCQ
jgi:hypothetical protein